MEDLNALFITQWNPSSQPALVHRAAGHMDSGTINSSIDSPVGAQNYCSTVVNKQLHQGRRATAPTNLIKFYMYMLLS